MLLLIYLAVLSLVTAATVVWLHRRVSEFAFSKYGEVSKARRTAPTESRGLLGSPSPVKTVPPSQQNIRAPWGW